VKSAILLGGLYADGPVSVMEPAPSRDHSERMLRWFGARIETGERSVRLAPGELRGSVVHVPGDISSAAFLLVAGTIAREARVTVTGVGVNPTRTGALEVLEAMGARVERSDVGDEGEPIATLTVETSSLRGATVGGALVPRLIDEIPALVVAAAVAEGTTEIRDAAELRVKESDRIAALARELGRLGARIEERPDGLTVAGGGPLRGARVESGGDHRMAMALAVAALVAEGETLIEDTECVATSYPRFVATINALTGRAAITVEA
jgi:3-phosphoshikimate 1-carboxyvinyltransferase